MRIAFSSMAFPGRDVAYVAEFAGKHGFDAVELSVREGLHLDVNVSSRELKKIKSIFNDQGIRIESLSGYAKFNSNETSVLERNLYEMIKTIEIADALDVSYVRSIGGRVPVERWNTDKNRFIGTLAEYLSLSVEKTDGSGVEILQSTHSNFCVNSILKNILQLVNSDRIGILWCVLHPLEAGESVDVTWNALKAYIKLVHLKDALTGRLDTAWQLAPLFKGELPLKKILTLLVNEKFEGAVSIEWEKHMNPKIEDSYKVLVEGREKIMKTIRELEKLNEI